MTTKLQLEVLINYNIINTRENGVFKVNMPYRQGLIMMTNFTLA